MADEGVWKPGGGRCRIPALGGDRKGGRQTAPRRLMPPEVTT